MLYLSKLFKPLTRNIHASDTNLSTPRIFIFRADYNSQAKIDIEVSRTNPDADCLKEVTWQEVEMPPFALR